MSTILTAFPSAAIGFLLSSIVAYMALKTWVIEPQRRIEARFVEYLRGERKSEIEKDIVRFLENDRHIDSKEWGILSTQLLEYGQQWSNTQSDKKDPSRIIVGKLAEDAVSKTHYLSKNIISRVLIT